jgi:hypothetical protein
LSSTRTGKLLTRPSATMCNSSAPYKAMGDRLRTLMSWWRNLYRYYQLSPNYVHWHSGSCACLIVRSKNGESFTTDTSGRDLAAPGTAALFMSNAESKPGVHVTGCQTTLGAKVVCLPNKCLRSPI